MLSSLKSQDGAVIEDVDRNFLRILVKLNICSQKKVNLGLSGKYFPKIYLQTIVI